MKKISWIIYGVCFVFFGFIFYIHDFIISAIEHNVAINLLISVILMGGIIFALISAYQISRKQRVWKKIELQDDIPDSMLTLGIFGKQFCDIFTVGEKNKKNY